MASGTREKLIQTAHDLFYLEGFHTVGLDRIIADVGVTKTTFYNHFPSKDDLIVEVLRWHDGWWQETFRRMLRRHGGDTPRGQLLAVPDALGELFGGATYNGCMFVNVAVQFPLPHDPAHQMAAAHKAAMEDILREISGYAGARDALALAKELSLILEGAYVTLQILRDTDSIEVARRLVRLVV
ncbi:MAG: TetR family transcriptional regulator, partial [Phycisphaerales bacterium]|nr:TetR family transcriptional regulator [Phycisphaerales bacterium]